MCGLTGIFSRNAIHAGLIEAALQSIAYRGKDDRRLFTFSDNQPHFFSTEHSSESSRSRFSQTGGILAKNWLGFNRLAIVDRSEAGMQPFWDEASQTAFMMVGELYNYQDIFRQFFTPFEQSRFFSGTDTEVAFRLFLKLGAGFIQQLRGMFTIVISDFRHQKVRVYRDKIGMKPVFYAHTANHFIVASEPTAILNSGLIEKKLNNRGLAYLLYLESSPWESSIYQNIVPLPPGHLLEFDLQTWELKKTCYWHLTFSGNKTEITAREMENDVLETAQLHLAGDVKKALSQSGGIDSGVLAYAFGKLNAGVKAFSINPHNTASDETEYARLNAENAGLPFENFQIPASVFWPELQHYLLSEDEPNNTPEPTTYLSHEINRQGYAVLYNALGPDEIFGGYSYYQQLKNFQSLNKLTRLLPFIPHGKTADLKKLGLLYLPTMKRETISWNQIKALFPDESHLWQHPFEYQKEALLKVNPDFTQYPVLKQFSYWDLNVYIGAHHTYRADQAAMKSTIEMRFPFLDAAFVSKYFQNDTVFRNIEKENKPLFRQLANRVLLEAVLKMPKKGFNMPVTSWLKPHQQIIQSQLQELKAKNIVPGLTAKKPEPNVYLQWQLLSLNQLF